MKRVFVLLVALVLAGTLTACGGTGAQGNPEQPRPAQEENQSESSGTPQSAPPRFLHAGRE